MKYFLSICAFCLALISLQAADIKYDSPQTFFAGMETTINVKVDGLSGKKISWSIRCSGLAVAKSETSVPESGSVEIKFTPPEIKDGIAVSAEFTCTSGDSKLVRNIFFFPPNPFSLNKKMLEDMKIGLWAPTGDETARKLFDSLGVAVSDIANFADFDGKLLIVAGMDFGNFSGIESDLTKICQAGSTVLIINPAGGILPLKSDTMKSLLFSQNGKISELDKRFDSESWGDSVVNDKFLNIVPVDNGIGVEVSGNNKAFSFMSAKIGKGELLIVTWDIFGKADKSPTPALILEKIISEAHKRTGGGTEK